MSINTYYIFHFSFMEREMVPGKEKEDLPVALVAQWNNRTLPGDPETGLVPVVAHEIWRRKGTGEWFVNFLSR